MGIKTGIPSDLITLIEALVIMFVAAPGLIRWLYRFDPTRMPKRFDDNPASKQEGSAA
jgi:ABC-type uncharacterized transport system permease subunit